MIITQTGIVDIIPEYNRALRPIFCISEGDKASRSISITVKSGGENFTIPGGSSVWIIGKKTDGTIFSYTCSYAGFTVTFPISEQMSAKDGIVLCELRIINGSDVLGSANFVYWVEPSPVQNGTASESDLNVFLEAILGAEKLDRFYANVEDMVAQAVENMQIHEGQTVIDASLSVSGAAADAKATGDIVRAFMNALITETTEEATIATCDDAAGGLPLKTLTANIVPAQAGSGDPSPDNVRAITGYTGVTVTRTDNNISDPDKYVYGTTYGITRTNNGGGVIGISGTATGSSVRTISLNAADNEHSTLLKAGHTYYISGFWAGLEPSTSTIRLDVRPTDAGGTILFHEGTSGGYTPDADVYVRINLRIAASYSVPAGVTCSPVLSIDVKPSEFESYVGETYPVALPSAVGTFYGGTLNVYDDGSGTLTVTKNSVATFDGSENWTVTAGAMPSYRVARGSIPANAKGLVSNMLIFDDQQTAVNGHGYVGTTNVVCYLGSASAENLDAWKASLATTPMQIVYMTGDPITYALNALQVVQMLSGVNNIWTDTAGTLTAEYYASTGLYVEKKVNAQRNMIAGVEEAMIATQNYSIGDLLIVGNTLYKVTAAISSGAALVVGTNATETTVAEQLLALA